MSQCTSKILFFHGLDSSRESTKFHAIDADHKYCIDVDYRNLNYATVAEFYNEIIEKIHPDILVGHSLGGYWALKMSQQHQIPCVIANPSLAPYFRDDYPAICDNDLQHDIPQLAYIELGDEILDMHAVQSQLEDYMQVEAVPGGHHRLETPERINPLILQIQQNLQKS
ncbi:YqiA/YcfP family alpha/beta fold hydrolase [Acinetobacter schindleri]|uniref:YqiA/YcfP family alpha/beta fold hydrolase n=1 Tax=Acinetobacter schindleri TaxID=108981 RepID=UPI003D02AF62